MATKNDIASRDIADALRAVIENSGETATAIAAGSGVAIPQITRFVRGERDMQLSTAAKLAAYFGLELRPVKKRKG